MIEFPDSESARRFYNAPDYQEILPIALQNSNRDLVIVEGA